MGLNELISNQTFSWKKGKDNKLFIYFNGKEVMILKGQKSQKLLEELFDSNEEEEQYLLARITGNFKRGNEKQAKSNLKNR
ncbi:hypothetical protein [Carnobacterium maltaromaticum]|uniref:hypothetical protein n=1 Tax=Carnobacterium maltaromaticum TaxID=2751 RepID=UPI00295F1C33|nr:hypothetical protein [Carnobacterium maltaromaticum]